jgi:hypothetical protein
MHKVFVDGRKFFISSELLERLNHCIIKNINGKLWIDRNPRCFCIFIDNIRGYSIKMSKLVRLSNSSGINIRDFLSQLYEDINAYHFPELKKDLDNLIRGSNPELCLEFNISYSEEENLEEEKKEFSQYFKVFVENIILFLYTYFYPNANTRKIIEQIRHTFHKEKDKIDKIYYWALFVKKFPTFCFIYKIVASVIIYGQTENYEFKNNKIWRSGVA